MNRTVHGVKHTKDLPHLAPIAPAPSIAPRPVQVLPKPSSGIGIASSASTVGAKQLSASSSTTSMTDLESQSLPCIITSKQWVLPPRPKAGRKPTNVDKKKQPSSQPQVPAQQHHEPVVPKRQNSMSSVTSNMNALNITKAQSENLSLAPSSSTITGQFGRDVLKSQLDSATQENEKLKSIISWLKIEIEQLQRLDGNSGGAMATRSNIPSMTMSPDSIDAQTTAAQIHYQLHGTQLNSTQSMSNMSMSSRDASSITVDPKDIGMMKPRKKKRQYKKKEKQQDAAPPVASAKSASNVSKPVESTTHPIKTSVSPVQVKLESSPSPLAIPELNPLNSSGLPTVETIMSTASPEPTHTTSHPSKRCKTVKIERATSIATHDLLSPPTHPLDRTSLSTPGDFGDLHHAPISALSRTTSNTTIDPMDLGWPGKECAFCQGEAGCVCLGKDDKVLNDVKEEESQDLIGLFEDVGGDHLYEEFVNF
ncbi:hypothetical protein BON22_2683 [Cyberlindnera fabianii]|uniref:Hap4 transcription factor heteromerisation domain-containing protein n=1 Tax=Cyberlindnera fabianii TaxID=36022 RepID=A0A1V2L7G4_CYBFA|nr:hypothetical protein BON22_2683 [Cyberlindnera fabianii]